MKSLVMYWGFLPAQVTLSEFGEGLYYCIVMYITSLFISCEDVGNLRPSSQQRCVFRRKNLKIVQGNSLALQCYGLRKWICTKRKAKPIHTRPERLAPDLSNPVCSLAQNEGTKEDAIWASALL